MVLNVRICIDKSITDSERISHHLNATTDFHFTQEDIPNSGYSYEENNLHFDVTKLLSAVEKSQLPTIFVTTRNASARTLVDPNKKWAIISFFSSTPPDFQTIAQLITAGTLELTDPERPYGLLDKASRNFDEALLLASEHGKKNLLNAKARRLSNIHVLLTHGIRTRAFWAESAKEILEVDFGSNCTISRYGYITLFSFLGSKTIQDGLAHNILVRLVELDAQRKGGRLSVIVHSYGSLLLAKALSQAEALKINLELDAVIMNGSILPVDYNWSPFTDQTKTTGVRVKRILNICGDKDIWPLLASKLAPNAGESGTFFFSVNSQQIINLRLKNCGHSDMLKRDDARLIWGKFLDNSNLPITTPVDLSRIVRITNFVARPLPLFLLLAIVAILLFWIL